MTIYTTLDAAGSPFEIILGQSFRTYRLRVADEQESAWSGSPVGQYAEVEVVHPEDALAVYAQADLDRYDIQKLATPTAPAGEYLASYALAVADGAISINPTFAPVPPPPVPSIVSRMQLKRALNQLGLLSQVQGGVDASSDEDLKIYWADTAEFHRDHPKLNAALASLGFTAGQADQAFTLAATLS